MSVDALPRHVSDDQSAEALAVAAALSQVPIEAHQRIITNFVVTAHRCKLTRDYGPLDHLIDSLISTSDLHRDPTYRQGLEEADAAMARGETVDGREYLENLHARFRR